jgi:hypothetical protein
MVLLLSLRWMAAGGSAWGMARDGGTRSTVGAESAVHGGERANELGTCFCIGVIRRRSGVTENGRGMVTAKGEGGQVGIQIAVCEIGRVSVVRWLDLVCIDIFDIECGRTNYGRGSRGHARRRAKMLIHISRSVCVSKSEPAISCTSLYHIRTSSFGSL